MYNKITLIGNVGQDPITKTLDSGKEAANFSLATSSSWKDAAGEKQTRTEWHEIIAYGKIAETIGKHVKKGAKLLVEGPVEYDKWEKEGQRHVRARIRVLHMLFLSPKTSTAADQTQPRPGGGGDLEDDIPF